MENTLENKAKFFAQYWGQMVLFHEHTLTISNVSSRWFTKQSIKVHCLRLKHLSLITDKNAEFIKEIEGYVSVQSCKDYLENHQEHLQLLSVDYLRSKGYALPYMGLLVEQLIEYGWVELIEK